MPFLCSIFRIGTSFFHVALHGTLLYLRPPGIVKSRSCFLGLGLMRLRKEYHESLIKKVICVANSVSQSRAGEEVIGLLYRRIVQCLQISVNFSGHTLNLIPKTSSYLHQTVVPREQTLREDCRDTCRSSAVFLEQEPLFSCRCAWYFTLLRSSWHCQVKKSLFRAGFDETVRKAYHESFIKKVIYVANSVAT